MALKMPRCIMAKGITAGTASVLAACLAGVALFQNNLVGFDEFLERYGAVGGRGRGELDRIYSDVLGAEFLVQFVGGGAGAEDTCDFGLFYELFYVVHNWVFDACVACTHDGAAVQNVP